VIDQCGVTLDTAGSYTLTNSVTDSANLSCIDITADDVVVDGAGYTIDGTTSQGSVGVQITDATNVTVRNLTVTEWEVNVVATNLSDGQFRNLTLSDADSNQFDVYSDGLQLYRSDEVTIADVDAHSNNRGILVEWSSNVTVERAHLYENYASQLRFHEVSDSVIRGSNGSASAVEAGFYLNASNNITLADSVATNNDDGTGVTLHATDNSLLENLTVESNEDGIRLQRLFATKDSSNFNTITNSTIRRNGGTGIDIVDSPQNTVHDNDIVDNIDGIEVRSSDATTHSVTISDNTVRENGGGILVSGYYRARYDEKPETVYGNTLRNNTVERNEYRGVWLLSAAHTTMRENALRGNEPNFVIDEYAIRDPSHSLEHYRHDIDTSNTVDGRPIYYEQGITDRTIGGETDAGFIGIVGGQNVTVEDQTLYNNSHGILLVGTQDATVRNVSVSTVTYGVSLIETDDSTVEHSRFRNMSDTEWAVMLADSSDRNRISENVLTQNTSGSTGLYVWNGSDANRITNNTVRYGPEQRGSYTTGILVGQGADATRVADNELVGGAIMVSGGYPVPQATTVTDNVVRDSAGEVGIEDGGNATVIRRNRVQNTTGYAPRTNALLAGSHAAVHNNTINGSVGDGIVARSDVVVANNSVRNTGANAIVLPGDGIVVRDNTVADSEFGVSIRGADNVVANNTIRNVTDPGFQAAGIYDYRYAERSAIRDNRLVDTKVGLWLTGTGEDGSVTRNSIRDSQTAIRIDGGEAINYTLSDVSVRNTSVWEFYEAGGDSTDRPGTVVRNLSLANTSISFTDRYAAVAVTAQPVCDPAGQQNLGVFLNTTNTSTSAAAWLNVTVSYDETTLDGAAESSIVLSRYNGSGWVPVSATRDAQNDTLQANLTSFGRLGVFANGTATCPSGLVALSETTPLSASQVSPALADQLRVEPTVAPSLTAELLRNTSSEYTLDVNASEDAQNVSLYLKASTLTTAIGNLSNVTLYVDGTSQPFYVEQADGVRWVGFEVDHFSNRTISFQTSTPADESAPNVTAFETTVTDQTLTTRLNTTEQLATLTVEATAGGSTVRTLSLADFSEQTVGLAGENYTYLNTTNLSTGTYNVTLVTAADDAGNDGASGQRQTVTIASQNPLSIGGATAIDVTDGDGNVTGGDVVEIQAEVSGTVGSVTVNASAFGGSESLSLTDGDSDGTYNATFTVDLLAAGDDGDYPIDISATNTAETETAQTNTLSLFRVDGTAPILRFQSVADGTDGDGVVSDGDRIEVRLLAYDLDSGLSSVKVSASAFGVDTVAVTDADGDDVYNGSITVDVANAAADGGHSLTATATNTDGVSGTTTSAPLSLRTSRVTEDGNYTLSVPQASDASLFEDSLRFRRNVTEGTDRSFFTSVETTDDGGYILAGQTNGFGAGAEDGWVVKLAADGSVAWNRTYGGVEDDGFGSASAQSGSDAVAQTADGGYVVVGSSYTYATIDPQFPNVVNTDPWALKLDASGNVVWNRSDGTTLSDGWAGVEAVPGGGVVMAGAFDSSNARVLKLDSSGTVVWNYTQFPAGTDSAYRASPASVERTSDGGYIVVGSKTVLCTDVYSDSECGVDETETFGWALKLTSNGTVAWEQLYGIDNTAEGFFDVAETPGGQLVFAGSTVRNPGGDGTLQTEDGWLVKTDSTGAEQWNHVYEFDNGTYEALKAVEITNDGTYVAVGRKSEDDDGWLLATNASGYPTLSRSIGADPAEGFGDEFFDVTINGTEQWGIAGTTGAYGPGSFSGWFLETSNGTSPTASGPAPATVTVATDSSGDYTSIQNAVNESTAGAKIVVDPGTYREEVIIDKNVTLVGRDGATLDGSTLSGFPSGFVIPPGSTAAPTIAGFRIVGYQEAISAGAFSEPPTTGDFTIRNVTLVNNTGGLNAPNAAGAWTMRDSQVLGTNNNSGIYAYRASGSWTVENVTVSGHVNAGISAYSATGDWVIANSTLRGNALGEGFLREPAAIDAANTSGQWTVRRTRIIEGDDLGLNATAAASVGNATRNYWNATDGPSGDFAGSGVRVLGNVTVSPYYTDVNVTTLSGQADTPPAITNATARNLDGSSDDVRDGHRIEVSATVSDADADLDSVSANATDFGAGTVRMLHSSGATYTATFVVDAANASSDGSYAVEVVANDSAGNTATATTDPLTLSTSSGGTDRIPPVLSNASITDFGSPQPDLLVNDGDRIEVTVEVNDTGGSGVDRVTVDASGFGAETVRLYDNDSDDEYNATFAVDAATAQPDGRIAPKITAVDGQGNTNATRTQFALTLDTTAPSASLVVNRSAIQPGQAVQFDASGSNDSSGIEQYAWDFDGDGRVEQTSLASDSSKVVSHRFNTTGVYNATLEITDQAGNTANESATITVETASTPRLNATLLSEENFVGSPLRVAVNATATSSDRTLNRIELAAERSGVNLSEQVTCPANASVCTTAISLIPRNSTWNGTGYGTLTVEITAVNDAGGETTDHVVTEVYITGDATGDGSVDIMDAVRLGRSWQTARGDAGYTDAADVNNDGVVNIFDAVLIGTNWQAVAEA
jgi:parallel beta-helix repeat protein